MVLKKAVPAIPTKGSKEIIGIFKTSIIEVIEVTDTTVSFGKVTMLTSTRKEVKYDIKLRTNTNGNDLEQTVISVKWMNGETELAFNEDKELSGNLTFKEDAFTEVETYADTIIEVVINDGINDMDPIIKDVESFEIIFISHDEIMGGWTYLE